VRNRTAVWRDILIYTAVWTVLGLFSFALWVVNAQYIGHLGGWPSALGSTMLDFYTLGVTTPILVWLVRRVPIVQRRAALVALLYLAVMVACVVLKWLIHVPLANLFFHKGWTVTDMLARDSYGVFLAELIFVVLLIAVEGYRTAQRSDLRASQLQAQLSSAQLDVLRSQLHPHFLFNTLNSISALMHRDVDAADTMLSRLSDMLRLTLDSSQNQEGTLRSELEAIRLYVSIMDARFGDRLVVNLDIPDALLAERVPSFLLQPLVENAVRHGIGESALTTSIRISGSADPDALTLRIADDGRGLPPDGDRREGIGLRNTRRRLTELYGAGAGLEVANRDGGGTEVVVRIPRRVGLVEAG
jgi:two-component system LytT family sensor kinase